MGLSRNILRLAAVALILSIFSVLAFSQIIVSSDKDSYSINELVTISLSDSTSKTQVVISSGPNNYKFLGIPNKKVNFIPREEGSYKIKVTDPYLNSETTMEFRVESISTPEGSHQATDGSSSLSSNIILNKKQFKINELVNVNLINLNPDKITISNGVETYKFLGDIENQIDFIPSKEGTYIISLYKNDLLLEERSFIVIPNPDKINDLFSPSSNNFLRSNFYEIKPNRVIKKKYVDPKVMDSYGKRQNFIIKTSDKKMFNSEEINEILLNDWEPEFIVEPKDMRLKKVNFKNIDLQNGFDLGLERIDPDNIDYPKKGILDVFAIDPERLNFTYAVMTIEAVGNEIYKCADWNFIEQECYGEWVKILDTAPGKNYTVYLTPKDPAYLQRTKTADNCYNERSVATCTATEVSAISADSGSDTYVFHRRSGNPVRVSFENTTETAMDEIVECSVYIDGYDSDNNRWTVQLGNYTANTWDTGTGQTITTPEATYTYDCMSYFNAFTGDYRAFNDFGVRISTNDAGGAATAYIDWVRVYINFSLKDLKAPYYSSILAGPSSPRTFSPTASYQFNTTWNDDEDVDQVWVEHNFSGSMINVSMTGNSSSIYYYDYGNIVPGTYVWKTWANDTSNNINYSMPFQIYIINKANPVLNLTLDGQASNISVERKDTVTINGSLVVPPLSETISVHIGLVQIDFGSSPLVNDEQFNQTGIFEVRVEYSGNENYSSSSLSYHVNVTDTIPPATITGLSDTSNGTTWIFWNWTNPLDDDYNHSEAWVNGTFYSNVYSPIDYINVTDRLADTIYEIQIRTVDDYGNVNGTWVTDLGRTKASADITPPIISNVKNTSITDSSVNISFETDEPAKPRVHYGTVPGTYTDQVGDEVFDQMHWFIISGLLPSTTYYYITSAIDIASNEANSTEYFFTTQPDATSPNWSNPLVYPTSPATYTPTSIYQFNTTWTDNGFIDTIWIEHNFNGSMYNYSISGNLNSIYYYNYGNIAAGTYSWRTWANDSAGNMNSTSWQSYTINKANSIVNLTINGTDGNYVINETDYANLTGYLLQGEGNITLWIGSKVINNGTSPLTNITQFNKPGIYNIKTEYSPTQNYSISSETHTLTVKDIIAPNVTLMDPPNNYEDLDGDMVFTINVTDTGILSNCSIYINDTLNYTKTIFSQGINTFTINDFSNNDYTWQVRCNDTANNEGISQRWNFSVSINEYYPQIYPVSCIQEIGICDVALMNISDTQYQEHDYVDKQDPVDYVYINFSNPNIPLGSTIHWMNITHEKYQQYGGVNLGSFQLEWYNSTLGDYQVLCTQNPVTDTTPPSYDTVLCDFNQSQGDYPTISQINSGLQLRARWQYDGGEAANKYYGTNFIQITLKYTEDVTPPTVELISPENNDPKNVGNVKFDYRPSDANLVNCTIWGDFNGLWESNYTDNSPISGEVNSFMVYLDEGYYTWNVVCLDIANNYAFANQNWSVNITNPNIEVLSEYIKISQESPKEGQQVMINATIVNRGNVNVTQQFKVQFYDGDPKDGGIQIGTNQTIASLGVGKNKTVNVSWIIPRPGNLNIYVLADTPLETNGTVKETDETNNQANRTIDVPAWTWTYGNISAIITLDTKENRSFSNWNQYSPQGNVYAVETGSSINWNLLQALGRKVDDTPSSEDFNQADSQIGMSGFIDSLYSTFTNSGVPKITDTFFLYNNLITDVPIINSSASANFITGILWDTGDGGSEYDGTQDIIFVTKINQDNLGKYGIYDYELKVPALLREYNETGYDTIDYYTEIS